MIHYEQMTRSVCLIAQEIGNYQINERMRLTSEHIHVKSANNFVTDVDEESERRIVKSLQTLLPSAGFITEEGTTVSEEKSLCWIVDPLDGTTNYVHGMSPYCVSIALREGEEVVLGVVYEPKAGECFSAWKGGGAFLNGNPIRVSQAQLLSQSLLQLGFPYDAERYRPFVLRLLEEFYGNVHALRIQGSAAIELCYLAAGRAEARIESSLNPWDVAAGGIILREAGGRMTDYSGGNSCRNGQEVVASNGFVHDDLLSKVSICLGKYTTFAQD